MIGIDLTRISRFENINLERFSRLIGQTTRTPKEAAKVWACLEALVKARGVKFSYSKINITFPQNSRPIVEDNDNILCGKYTLSLAHEGDYVTAIAIKE